MIELVAVQASESPHVELHLLWGEHLLLHHGMRIMNGRSEFRAALRAMHQAFAAQYKDIGNLCHGNHYNLAFLTAAPARPEPADTDADTDAKPAG
mmetsp:Transcript_25565/g.51167  ORF Transcript_25565/g.51167 Transcript_25565/m.51167 type:complete len:95 (-) Transcript_25565:81-365(-)